MALAYTDTMLLRVTLCQFQSALHYSSQSDLVVPKRVFHNFIADSVQQHNNIVPAESKVVRNLIWHVTALSSHTNSIRLRAAMDLSLILATYYGSEAEAPMITSIEQNASKILSILSTRSVALIPTDDPQVVQSLCRLAISSHFRIKMVKRRCTLLALTRHLSHHDATTRESIFLVLKELCVDDECRACLRNGATENVDILREGIVEAAQVTSNPQFQLLLVSALGGLIHVMNKATDDVLKIFETYAYNGASDALIIESAINLSKSIAPQLESTDHRYLRVMADFTTFQFPEIRREALKTMYWADYLRRQGNAC